MMVYKAGFLRLLVLFLGLSLVLSSLAVPTTRSLKSTDEAFSFAEQEFQDQDEMDLVSSTELIDAGEGHVRGRMAVDTTDDYPGTGANNHHDPKAPGSY